MAKPISIRKLDTVVMSRYRYFAQRPKKISVNSVTSNFRFGDGSK